MKKIMILVFLLILLTGCSVEYDLKINEDLSIVEEAKLTGTDEFFRNYYRTTKKNVLLSFLDEYESYLKEKNYEYELKDDDTPYVLVKNNYSDINTYINNSILFNDYFDEINYTVNGNISKIETVGYNENNPDNPERFDVTSLDIKITCPYKVTDHNAYKVDKKTNTYYYHLDEKSNYKILLEFNNEKKYNRNEDIFEIIFILLLIIIGSWIFVIYYSKKQKNN